MELKIRKNGEIYIIDVNGEMDLYNSYKLKELVMKMLEKNVHSFVINLEQVDYIDSSGIGALIYICSTIKKQNLKHAKHSGERDSRLRSRGEPEPCWVPEAVSQEEARAARTFSADPQLVLF